MQHLQDVLYTRCSLWYSNNISCSINNSARDTHIYTHTHTTVHLHLIQESRCFVNAHWGLRRFCLDSIYQNIFRSLYVGYFWYSRKQKTLANLQMPATQPVSAVTRGRYRSCNPFWPSPIHWWFWFRYGTLNMDRPLPDSLAQSVSDCNSNNWYISQYTYCSYPAIALAER